VGTAESKGTVMPPEKFVRVNIFSSSEMSFVERAFLGSRLIREKSAGSVSRTSRISVRNSSSLSSVSSFEFPAQRAYPFMSLIVIPWMKYLWQMKKMTITS
jgi:hypothetical protein